MNSLTVKILAALVSVLLITTIWSQIYYVLHDKHDTEEAVLEIVNEDVPFSGIVIRDETVVTYNGTGVMDYKYPDGSKISINSTIAEVFASEEEIAARDEIARIDAEIELLEKAQDPGTANYVEPETLQASIRSDYDDLLDCIEDGQLDELSSIRESLTLSSDLYNVVTNTETDFNDRIKALRTERNSLKNKANAPKDIIKAADTGYFVSYADGYEDVLSTDMIDKLTEEDINEVLKGDAVPSSKAIGKTFASYNCKIAGVVDKDPRIVEDASLDLVLNSTGDQYYCTVDSITPCGEYGEKILVILNCDRIDETLVSSRQLYAKLIFEEYEGIKVPRSAIRFNSEGEKGVYVILGKDISFKKINVIYEGNEDYVLSENTSDEDYLLLYDQILLEVVTSKDITQSQEQESGGSDGNSE